MTGWVVITICSFAMADNLTPYKGYAAINQILKERVTGPSRFELGRYVGEPYAEPKPGSLIELLGTYSGTDTGAAFRNGSPNAMNLLLWSILLSRFSHDIGHSCSNLTNAAASRFSLSNDFKKVLAPVCEWPESVATSPVSLKAYWDGLMGYDAPEDEFENWLAFAQQEARSGSDAATAISRITVAALLNPYFLLRD